jgi:hypothetical protein
MAEQNEMIMYTSEDGVTKIDIHMIDDNVWLSQMEMAELFEKSVSTISRHIKNIFEEGELGEKSNLQKMQIPFSDKPTRFYSIDVVIAVGYRVKSTRGIQFRNWATTILKEYLQKGYVLNDEKLKDPKNDDYFEQLIDRIRDIRTSEKRMYAKILEIFSTSVDYNENADETRKFFALVQNKLHFAITGHTAAELIYDRANADKQNMGLTYMKTDYPHKNEVTIAKNYLSEPELKDLNQMTTAYLDIAERRARNRQPMYMKDWITQVDSYIDLNQDPKLEGNGNVSKQTADKKALNEYARYTKEHPRISKIEEDYLKYLDDEIDKLK